MSILIRKKIILHELLYFQIPHPLFQNWNFKILDIQAPQFSDFETQEKIDSIVIDMVGQVLKLGGHLAKQPKV